jgi:hypothetical protein
VCYSITVRKRQAQTAPRYGVDQLKIWDRAIPGVKTASLPSTSDRPNPLVVGEYVFVSIFSPAQVVALRRKDGAILWQKSFLGLGADSVDFNAGRVLARTATTLRALNSASGDVLWSFCPYGESGETIYSKPTVHRGRVYIGDRYGYLHCLDARTGRPIWKALTSRAKNNDVNSTPLIVGTRVIVTTNAKRAVAYDARSGRREWITKLDGASAHGPHKSGRLIAAISDSVYFLTEEGRVVRRVPFRGRMLMHAVASRNKVFVEVANPKDPLAERVTAAVAGKGEGWEIRHKLFCVSLAHSNEAKLVFLCHMNGIEARRAGTGRLAYEIVGGGENRFAPIETKGGVIYALEDSGVVQALRQPRG